MRHFGPIRIKARGLAANEAGRYIPIARLLLGKLKQRMALGGLQYGTWRRVLDDGTLIELISYPVENIVIITPPVILPETQLVVVEVHRGIVCHPASDSAPSGWGEPFTDENGEPIVPGTPGGDNPRIVLPYVYQQGWSLIRNTNPQVAGVDWTGAWQDGKWTRLLSIRGWASRHYIPGWTDRHREGIAFDQGADFHPFGGSIFENGVQLSKGPTNFVSGVAIHITEKEVDGITVSTDWLIATAYSSFSIQQSVEKIYRKNLSNPDAVWEFIADLDLSSLGGDVVAVQKTFGTGWFFNGSGTKALSVRKVTLDVPDSEFHLTGLSTVALSLSFDPETETHAVSFSLDRRHTISYPADGNLTGFPGQYTNDPAPPVPTKATTSTTCVVYTYEGTTTIEYNEEDAGPTIVEDIVAGEFISDTPVYGRLKQTFRSHGFWRYENTEEISGSIKRPIGGSTVYCTGTTTTSRIDEIANGATTDTAEVVYEFAPGTEATEYGYKLSGGVIPIKYLSATNLWHRDYDQTGLVTGDSGGPGSNFIGEVWEYTTTDVTTGNWSQEPGYASTIIRLDPRHEMTVLMQANTEAGSGPFVRRSVSGTRDHYHYDITVPIAFSYKIHLQNKSPFVFNSDTGVFNDPDISMGGINFRQSCPDPENDPDCLQGIYFTVASAATWNPQSSTYYRETRKQLVTYGAADFVFEPPNEQNPESVLRHSVGAATIRRTKPANGLSPPDWDPFGTTGGEEYLNYLTGLDPVSFTGMTGNNPRLIPLGVF